VRCSTLDKRDINVGMHKKFLTCHYGKSIKNYLLFISHNMSITWVNCLMTQQVNCDSTQKNSNWMLLLQMQTNKNVKHGRIMCLQQIWAIICKLKKKTQKMESSSCSCWLLSSIHMQSWYRHLHISVSWFLPQSHHQKVYLWNDDSLNNTYRNARKKLHYLHNIQ